MAIANVPAKVIAPVVAVFGVKPVVPALNDVTPPVDAAHAGIPPETVRTVPAPPMPILDNTFVAEAYKMSPVVYVVMFVPPLPIARVPPTVTAPDVAVEGVRPVDAKVIEVTGVVTALSASSLTVPVLSL